MTRPRRARRGSRLGPLGVGERVGAPIADERPHAADDAVVVARVGRRRERSRHGIASATAALAEARGDLMEAADGYAAAAAGWSEFGTVTERAFALLGLGRCLVRLGRADEAAAGLSAARGLVTRLEATRHLLEIDALMRPDSALSS